MVQVLCSECGEPCAKCRRPVLNEYIIANDRHLHKLCHTCVRCNVLLGEQCYVIDSDLACLKCAEEVQAMRQED
jgi:hypothetical protein